MYRLLASKKVSSSSRKSLAKSVIASYRMSGITTSHNEYACHSIGEKRQNILNELKIMIDTLDDRPCVVKPHLQKRMPLMNYPGYVNARHPLLLPPNKPDGPMQTLRCHTRCHKFGPCPGTGPPVDYDPQYPEAETHPQTKNKSSNLYSNVCTKKGMKSPGAHLRVRNQSTELRGGVLYNSCNCPKRDGLQDRCPRKSCGYGEGGYPKCLANNPGPCCTPALAQRKYGP